MVMSGWKRERLLGHLTIGLVIVNTVLLLIVLSDVLRGEADSYHNEHARLVGGAISGILVSLGFLAKSVSAKGWLLVAALATVSISVVLAVK